MNGNAEPGQSLVEATNDELDMIEGKKVFIEECRSNLQVILPILLRIKNQKLVLSSY